MSFIITTEHVAPAHPEDAARNLAAWQALNGVLENDATLRQWLKSSAKNPDIAPLLTGIFGNSPFLAKLLLKYPHILHLLDTEGADQGWETLTATIQETLRHHILTTNTAAMMKALRQAKAQVALFVALADVSRLWPLMRITHALSAFAEHAIDAAANHLLFVAHKQGKITLPSPDQPTLGSGLIIFGMGKLGAYELNYSSDIDLIIFYERERLNYQGRQTEQHFYSRLAQDIVNLLQERTADGYVFRTDLRLRPDPASTPPAVTTDAAIHYYESVGQNWERAAMIKARPVGGDMEAGRQFLKTLAPFMWRRNLDFAAIQDILSIKRQINHRSGATIELPGHNVKLGLGGIREIEFFAQLHQLIWGGRELALRTPATLDTLGALVSLKHITRTDQQLLDAAYHFLRTLEHRLQMVEDHQTHSLPQTEDGIRHIACFMGYADSERFKADLASHLQRVHRIFVQSFNMEGLSAEEGNLVFTGVSHDPDTLRTLAGMGFVSPEAVSEMIMGWHHGKRRCTRTKRARQLLTELVPTILKHLSATANPDFAFLRFDEFLTRLPSGIQIFSLFSNNPQLLTLIADIVGSAPTLSDTLSRHPNLLESVLFSDFYQQLPSKTDLSEQLTQALSHTDHFDAKMEMLRLFKNEKQFQAGVQLLQGLITDETSAPFLSDLADILVDATYQLTLAEFTKSHGNIEDSQFCILALGRLGGQELTFGSDVDLVFIYDVADPSQHSDGAHAYSASSYYSRFCQRLISALTTGAIGGKLYEVDTRLRPSGDQGLLAVSLPAFCRYFDEMAWTFEYMAMTKARVIAGNSELTERLTHYMSTVLQRERETATLAADVRSMRDRIEKEYATTNPWDIKHVRGGLMDIDFLAQYLLLKEAHHHPELLQRTSAGILNAAASLPKPPVPKEALATLQTANRFLTRLFNLLRLITADQLTFNNAPAGLKKVLSRNMETANFETLEQTLKNTETDVRNAYATVLDGY